jgi:hypothetical protein
MERNVFEHGYFELKFEYSILQTSVMCYRVDLRDCPWDLDQTSAVVSGLECMVRHVISVKYWSIVIIIQCYKHTVGLRDGSLRNSCWIKTRMLKLWLDLDGYGTEYTAGLNVNRRQAVLQTHGCRRVA